MPDTPATSSAPAASTSTFGSIFSEILSKGVDTASAYANSKLAIASAEAQIKAQQGAAATVTAANAQTASQSPKWLPWAIGGGVALLALFGLGMFVSRK